jgi:hypothetical protein
MLIPWASSAAIYSNNVALDPNASGLPAGNATLATNLISDYASNFRVVSASLRVRYIGKPLDASGLFYIAPLWGSDNSSSYVSRQLIHSMAGVMEGARAALLPHGLEDTLYADAEENTTDYYKHGYIQMWAIGLPASTTNI